MSDQKSILLKTTFLVGVLMFLNATNIQAVTPPCGTLLTANTTFDSDMNCPSTALFLQNAGSNNVIVDCAGFTITAAGGAISASNVTGVTVKNCNINTDASSGYGFLGNNISSSEVSNNTITTAGTFGQGVWFIQSSNNLIDGNTISTTGLASRAILIENQSSNNVVSDNNLISAFSNGVRIRSASDNNILSDNSITSDASNAVRIDSSSFNQLTGNTFMSPSSFVLIRNLGVSNGGLSVDDSGNIFAVENNFGGSGGSGGAVTTLIQVDPNTGDPISYLRLLEGGVDLGFGFGALEIMPDGRFLALRGGNSSSLYEINPVSGEVSLVPLTLPVLSGNLNGLQATGVNTLLATTNQEGELASIDLVSGVVTRLGNDGLLWSDLAMHPTSGRLYALSRWRFEPSGTGHLYEIDPASGDVIQEIGDTGIAFPSDIDFSASGVLYANDGGLYTVNTTNGVGTYIGGFGPDPFEPPSQNNTLTNQTFTSTTMASVQFLQPINLPPSIELSLDESAIQIGQNSVFVDSAQYPFLDVPARITFENLGGASRILLVDLEDDGTFEPCDPPQCSLVSFINGTLIFDVSGFTTYSSEEAQAEALVCDANSDSLVDIRDIRAIVSERNRPATSPDDPMDWDRNGVINILDARGCVLACTLPRCAVQ